MSKVQIQCAIQFSFDGGAQRYIEAIYFIHLLCQTH